jgi:hypothetical protein
LSAISTLEAVMSSLRLRLVTSLSLGLFLTVAAFAQSGGATRFAPVGPGEFLSAKEFSSGTGPISMAVGDLNNDGKADIVVGNEVGTSNNVNILLGNGDGTFKAATVFTSGNNPVSVALADLNKDGKLDLVTVDLNSVNVNLALGNGDGTFKTATAINTNSSGCWSVFVGDFNNDAKLDLAVGCSGGISVLLGNGDGTFQTPKVMAIGGGASGVGMTAADVNKDGKLDLLVPTGNQTFVVEVYLGNGDGTFQAVKNTPALPWPVAVSTGDFNADGKLDLVVGNQVSGNNVSILFGNGDGTFQTPTSYAAGGDGATTIVVGDFNKDGKPDVATANLFNNNVSILLGGSGGTLKTAITYGVATAPQAIVSADFNGDTNADLAAVSSNGDISTHTGVVSVLLGNNNGQFQAGRTFFVGSTCFNTCANYAAATADFNGDGKADAVVTNNQNNTVSVLIGNGDGTFTRTDYAVGNNPVGVAIGDFNNDKKLDLAVANYCSATKCDTTSGSLSILLGNGDGTFQAATSIALAGNPYWIAAADMNNDKKLDLIVSQQAPFGTPQVAVLLGNNDGTFGAAMETNLVLGGPTQLAVGDYNKDGKLDVAVSGANTVEVRLGNGDGTFGSASDISVFDATGIVTADLNKDKNLDLIVGSGGSGAAVFVLLGNGDGTFKTAVSYPGDAFVVSVAAADVNGDGKLDVVATGEYGADVWIANGDGTLQSYNSYAIGGSSNGLAVADWNKDGALDILALYNSTGFDTSSAEVLLNTGGTKLTLTSSANPSSFGQSVTFTATVAASVTVAGQAAPAGTATFKDGSTTLATVTLSSGTATYTTSALSVGSHSIKFTYNGNKNYNSHTSSALTQTVNQASTTTAISSSANPSSFGQTVTFTATVTASTSGTPTGTVTFKDGGTTLGTGTLNSSGQATFATSSLAVGSHSITAVYGGDSNHLGSTSPVLTQTVNQAATTTGLTSSLNPSTFGQKVTFTATVTASTTGTPTGKVTFKDGSSTLGTGTLNSSGQATFSTASLARGTHSITAVYGGDSNYLGSTSPALNQVVN